jgi:2'-5' RNA ligase
MRVFAAIEIPEDIKARILEFEEEIKPEGVTPVRGDAVHITLQFFGEIDEHKVEQIKSVMNGIKTGRFEVSLQGVSSFTPKIMRVIYIPVLSGAEKVSAIHKALAEGTGMVGDEKFVPHATVARVKRRPGAGLMDAIGRYSSIRFGSFDADSIVLKKSTLKEEGPVYEELYKSEL